MENTDNRKWLIIGIIGLVFIILINSNFFTIEQLTNLNKKTVRTIGDYFSLKNSIDVKVIKLKCNVGKDKFFIGNVNKNKFNERCPACGFTKNRDTMLVLVNEKNIAPTNCKENELIKCFNGNNISDCNMYVDKICNSDKVPFEDLEMIIDNVEMSKKTSFVLKTNSKSQTVMTAFNFASENKDNKVDKVNVICFDENLGSIKENQKFYIDMDGLPNDKIRFRMYFMIDDKRFYVGVCRTPMCDDVVCREKSCLDNFKFLCLYDNIKDRNVLVFEPEIMRII